MPPEAEPRFSSQTGHMREIAVATFQGANPDLAARDAASPSAARTVRLHLQHARTPREHCVAASGFRAA